MVSFNRNVWHCSFESYLSAHLSVHLPHASRPPLQFTAANAVWQSMLSEDNYITQTFISFTPGAPSYADVALPYTASRGHFQFNIHPTGIKKSDKTKPDIFSQESRLPPQGRSSHLRHRRGNLGRDATSFFTAYINSKHRRVNAIRSYLNVSSAQRWKTSQLNACFLAFHSTVPTLPQLQRKRCNLVLRLTIKRS